MVSFFSGLRYILVLAAAAVLFGALLMFWEAALMLIEGYRMARLDPDMSVVVAVLRATDKVLLGIVLMVVGCGIALGFIIDIPADQRSELPASALLLSGAMKLAASSSHLSEQERQSRGDSGPAPRH